MRNVSEELACTSLLWQLQVAPRDSTSTSESLGELMYTGSVNDSDIRRLEVAQAGFPPIDMTWSGMLDDTQDEPAPSHGGSRSLASASAEEPLQVVCEVEA